MGCHTWFYKPIPRLYDDVKASVIDAIKERIAKYERILAGDTSGLRRGYATDRDVKEYAYWVKKNGLRLIKRYQRLIGFLERHPFKEETIWRHYSSFLKGVSSIYLINGQFYDNKDTPHDIFRCGNFPENRLWSLEEAYAYYKNPDNHCVGYDSDWNREKAGVSEDVDKCVYERLADFFKKYPGGFIKFG